MQVMCAGCRHPIEMQDVGISKIVNLVTASIVIMEHPEQQVCPNCAVPVAVTIAEAKLVLLAAPVPVTKAKSLIIQP